MRRPWVVVVGLALLALVSFVSPFSYLPNPFGLHYLLVGGYRYDPHSPFVNRFATLMTHDPTPALTTKLDRLLGLTGLDPLDPQQPLVGYQVRAIITKRAGWDGVSFTEALVEFRYEGGGVRSYRIPVWQYGEYSDGERRTGWRYTGLDRIFAEHLALPYLPLATADSALRPGIPRSTGIALDLGPSLSGGWGSVLDDPRVRARWAPDGRRFSFRLGAPGTGGALWIAALDGPSPRQVTAHALDAAWSADGRLVYLRCPDRCPFGARFDLVVADPATGDERTLGGVPGRTLAVAGEAVYLLDGEALWRAPLGGGDAERLAPLRAETGWVALAITPDADRLAYGCDGDVCLVGPTGTEPVRVGLGYPVPQRGPATPSGSPVPVPAPTATIAATPRTSSLASLALAWSPDGGRLAIATGVYPGSDRGPELWVVDRAGRMLRRLPIGPDGATGEPTWTPDGRTILLTAFPRGGRRIVAIDADTGQVTDLSQPRWDAFAALSPDGARLLLWNGRGNFWLAPLVRRADSR